MGTIYKRGHIFWIKYYRNGKPYFESTHTKNETEAKSCRSSRHLTPFPQIKMTPFLLSLLQLIFQSVAAAIDIEDTCMMNKSVYNGRGNHIILKHFTPFIEIVITCKDN